ncbi:MauE/DoxX family redox-associated membrane protein [Flavobacterium sp. WG21]|uniref:MauE/DoxX family redox-associated membrane protein n=1 Tax=Flavobacterium sp. WG21 TaxID=1229487 RepID=UPI00034B9D16|nr:MauE/DoxX family redox-associated membrane protein [Flavobacterium sp. WG21]
MKKNQKYAVLLLRVALAAGFLSAVSSRLGLWGTQSSGWENFLAYTEQVNSFLPKNWIPTIAIASTILETLFALLLLIGYQTKFAAAGAAILTFGFALAMTYSFGAKEPLDYSVFTFSMAAFLLSTVEKYHWSLDEILSKNKIN